MNLGTFLGIKLESDHSEMRLDDAIVDRNAIKKEFYRSYSKETGIDPEMLKSFLDGLIQARAVLIHKYKTMQTKMKAQGKSQEEIDVQFKRFEDRVMNAMAKDSQIAFVYSSMLLKTLADDFSSSIDMADIPSFYSSHPEAYENPTNFKIVSYIFRVMAKDSPEQNVLEAFAKLTEKETVSAEDLEKFESHKGYVADVSSLQAINGTQEGRDYERIKNAKVGQIMSPKEIDTPSGKIYIFDHIAERSDPADEVDNYDKIGNMHKALKYIGAAMLFRSYQEAEKSGIIK